MSQQACALGVDAIGFVCFSGSPRFVPPERLAGLAAAVAPLVTPVLLFVDAPAVAVERALTIVPHALLQFHGDGRRRLSASPSAGRTFARWRWPKASIC